MIIAQRFNAGIRSQKCLESRRDDRALAKDIPLIILDSVPFEKGGEFLLERLDAMMFLLGVDVINGILYPRRANAECSLTLLPGETLLPREGVMNPLRRPAFDELDGLGDRDC